MAKGTPVAPLLAGFLAGLTLAACARQAPDEMEWARAALARNPALEIKATDAQARTFTVLVKETGELRVVRLEELVGAPKSEGSTPSGTPAVTASAAPAPAAAPASADTAAPNGDATAVSPEPPSPAPAPVATPFASRALNPGSSARAVPGQVLEAGPGYSIQAAGSGAAATAANAREPGPAGAVELRHDPIVCQGARLLHIDNQNLQFDGDGLSAEDGCEIHITNSRIRATGVGVSARAANVHIDNSLIEGDTASIDASDGAQIYTASSKFRGLSRQLDTASVHDLGGNVWN